MVFPSAKAAGLESEGVEDSVAQCIPQFPAASADYAGPIPWLPAGRHCRGGSYFYISRPGKSGGICHNRIRLSTDPGVRLMDLSDLYGSQSDRGYFL